MPLYTPRSGTSLYADLLPYIPRAKNDLFAELGTPFHGAGLALADSLFESGWNAGRLAPTVGGSPTLVRNSQSWQFDGKLYLLRNRNVPLFAPARRGDTSKFEGVLLQRGVEQQISQPFDLDHADWGSISVTPIPSLFQSTIPDYPSKTGWLVPDSEVLDTSEGVLDQDWGGASDPKTFGWVVAKRTAGYVRFRIYSAATERVYYKLNLTTGAWTALGSVAGLVSKSAVQRIDGAWEVFITATGTSAEDVKAIAYPMDAGESSVVTAFYYFGLVDGAVGGIVDGPENTAMFGDELTYTHAPTPQGLVLYESFVAGQRPSSDLLATPWVLGEEAPFLYRWEDDGDVGITYEPAVGSPVEVTLTPTWEAGDHVVVTSSLTALGDLRLAVLVNGGTRTKAVWDSGPTSLEANALPDAWGGEQILTVSGSAQRICDRLAIVKAANLKTDPVLGGALPLFDEIAIRRPLPNRAEAA